MSLRTPAAHSDLANTDDPAAVPTSHGRRMAWVSWVTGTVYTWPAGEKEAEEAHKWLVRRNERTPLPPEDIVWPAEGWPVNEDGRGLSVMDVRGADYLRLEQHTIARQTRAWERQNATTHGAIVTTLRAA
jgi:hypothetical protein